jgi:hypothetical protein
MAITWTSMPLDEPQELQFPDGQEIMIDCRDADFDHLGVRFSFGLDRVLPQAVDADERLEWPRVTVFTGNNPSEMFFFGGPIAYRLRSDGEIVPRVETHRNLAEYECGRLDVLRYQNLAVIVYEIGILAIDDGLRPRWLKRKYMGEEEMAIEGDLLVLRTRFHKPVMHRLTDGELLSSPKDYSPGVPRTRPDDGQMIVGVLGALDAEGLIRALSAVSAQLNAFADRGAADQQHASGSRSDRERLVRLKARLDAQTEKVSAVGSGNDLDAGFVEGLVAEWQELGLDLKTLLTVVARALCS